MSAIRPLGRALRTRRRRAPRPSGSANAVSTAFINTEPLFHAAFQASPEATAISRLADGTLLAVNDAFVALVGRSRDELVGRTTAELGLGSSEERARFVATFGPDSGVAERETSLALGNGSTRVIRGRSVRIDAGGEPCLVTVATDVTEQRAAEVAIARSAELARARSEELSAILDATPAALWIALDPECREVRGSRVGCEMLRAAPGTNLSKTGPDPAGVAHFTVWRDGVELAPEELPLQRAARDGREVRDFEEELRFDDGSCLHTVGSAVPLHGEDGAVRGAVAAFVDVTKLKEAQAALLEADRRKDEFLAILSHELRNPLSPILTTVELIRMRAAGAFERECGVIERQARHLVRLVDDLLDVSRLVSGKIQLVRRPVELGEVVTRAIETVSPLVEAKKHAVEVDVPARGLVVDGDEERLVQVVSNLLTNAARYTPEGGHIRIAAAATDGQAVLEVRDDGAGIDPEVLPRIFDMYFQASRNRARREPGLGIGLALVHSLTALHGGTVEALSEGPGKGSKLVVRLPLAARAAGARPADDDPATLAESLAPSAHAYRILVVDDHEDSADAVAAALSGCGHEVAVANDPATALALARSFRPRIAILDIGLPVMDGYELAGRIRELIDPAPTLIALTGFGQRHDVERSTRAGFDLHLVKPIEPRLLREILDALVLG
ncbi:MAG: response regulator [Deltaproteobacteria bacterium]|nr:response regulator [Deltaproteobacteria bacterium]